MQRARSLGLAYRSRCIAASLCMCLVATHVNTTRMQYASLRAPLRLPHQSGRPIVIGIHYICIYIYIYIYHTHIYTYATITCIYIYIYIHAKWPLLERPQLLGTSRRGTYHLKYICSFEILPESPSRESRAISPWQMGSALSGSLQSRYACFDRGTFWATTPVDKRVSSHECPICPHTNDYYYYYYY